MDLSVLWLFFAILVFFHAGEVLLVWAYNPEQLSWDSTLITWPYTFAVSCGVSEFVATEWMWPSLKHVDAIFYLGLTMAVVGELLRKVGMVTAKHNFTHLVQYEKRQKHRLVTWGIYRFVRHPGYLGFLLFAVGLQVMLHNVVSTLGFAYVLWRFFTDRLEDEEEMLGKFFGAEHAAYRARVWSGIPGWP
eukprot:EC794982.1.p3 GENE.EC794982.1~~EC794982.1.p3  ORF type:complete len:190 (+),score=75.70 EC794982.1:16-585(+)